MTIYMVRIFGHLLSDGKNYYFKRLSSAFAFCEDFLEKEHNTVSLPDYLKELYKVRGVSDILSIKEVKILDC